jgi:hypothetical protein
MGDVFEMMTYLLVVIISCIIMTVCLKRKARKNKR